MSDVAAVNETIILSELDFRVCQFKHCTDTATHQALLSCHCVKDLCGTHRDTYETVNVTILNNGLAWYCSRCSTPIVLVALEPL